jgi:hypothetical protein
MVRRAVILLVAALLASGCGQRQTIAPSPPLIVEFQDSSSDLSADALNEIWAYTALERITVVLFEEDVETRKTVFQSIHAAAHRAFIGSDFSLDDGRNNLAEVRDIVTDAAYAVRKRLFNSYNYYFVGVGVIPLLAGAAIYASKGLGCFSGMSDLLFGWLIATLWIVAGATISVWAEFAFRTRGGLKFERLLELSPGRWQPSQRVLITVVTAFIFAFLLANKIILIGLGNVLLNDFLREPSLSLAVGGVTGFGLAAVMDIIFRLHPQSQA